MQLLFGGEKNGGTVEALPEKDKQKRETERKKEKTNVGGVLEMRYIDRE